MPRYFFHIVQGHDFVAEDWEGEELADLDVVRDEAVQSAREIIAQGVLAGKDIDERELRIHDEAGQTVLRVLFKDVVS